MSPGVTALVFAVRAFARLSAFLYARSMHGRPRAG